MGGFIVLGSRSRSGLGLLLALVLVTGVTPGTPARAQASSGGGGVTIEVEGLDDLVAGTPSRVTLTARMTDRGTLRDSTPLRFVGRLSAGGDGLAAAAVGFQRLDGSFDALDVDDDGTFVFPREDRAPLSLGSHPALLASGGLEVALEITVADEIETELTVGLAESNERSAAVLRLSGAERLATAAAISGAMFSPGVDIAYISRADEYPDALSGGPSAGLGGNPILLTYSDELSPITAAELRRLQPRRIVVLGGRAAISDGVFNALRPLTEGSVTRVFGGDRFATAAAVALDRYRGPLDTVYIATGQEFADALSGGPAAGLLDAPILLVGRDVLPGSTAEALRALRPSRIVILGGSVAVSDEVEAALGDFADEVVRQKGATRYETSAAISAATFDPDAVHTVYLATGLKFPDSLAGSPPAIVDGAPMLLVTKDKIPDAVGAELQRLAPAIVVLLGGEGVVGEEIADAVAKLTQTIAPDRSRFKMIGSPAVVSFTPLAPLPPDPCDTDARVAAATASPAVEQQFSGTFAPGRPRPEAGGAGSGGAGVLAASAPDAPVLAPAGTSEDVTLESPSTASPTLLRLRGRFSATFTSPAGDYALDYRLGDGAWQPFPNPTATGSTEGGSTTLRLNAPIEAGIYDVRVVVQTAEGTFGSVQEDALETRVFVMGMGPMPIITPLVEGVSGQPQVFSVPPAGGLAYEEGPHGGGTRLKVVLSRAEQTHVDYPEDAPVQIISEEGRPLRGTAQLYVVRDQWAEIVYDMHPDDQPAGGTPTRYTFRIEGVDAAPVHESVIGGFFRTDIWHGVNIVFPVGEGAPVSSPEIADLRADTDWQEQHVSFGIHPALPAGGTVTVDLSEAVAGGVDYSKASAYFVGGGPHGEEVEMPGTVAFNAARTALVVTAGEEGWPSIQPPTEGPIPAILIEGVVTPDIEETFTVPFFRSGSERPGTTTFTVAPEGALVDVAASDLACGESDQTQYLGATLVRDLPGWAPIYISLGGAQRGGADYRDAYAEVLEGSGWAEMYVYEEFGDAFAYVQYYPGGGGADLDGDRIEIAVHGVHTDAVHESHLARFFREDAWTGTSTVFDIGIGSELISPYVADLESDSDWTYQGVSLALREDLAPGETLTVDLSSAEQGGASYDKAEVWAYDAGFGDYPTGEAALAVVDGTSAVVTYTAGDDGLPAGVEVYLEVAGVSTEAVEEDHVALIRRSGGAGADVPFAIRTFPSLRDVSVSDLEKATDGQQQTIRAVVVGDLEPSVGIDIDLSSASAGGADYSSAEASVTSGNGEVALYDFAEEHFNSTGLYFETGEDGIASGEVIEILLEGVGADDVDETHLVWLYRYDGWSSSSGVFNIGEGGIFVGSPYANDVFQASPGDIRQFFFFSPAQDLAAGETITIDLSSAQQGVVDYRNGTPDLFSGRGSASLSATETTAVLTYTAPAGGLSAGEGVGAHIHDLEATPTDDRYEAVFTHTPSGRSATTGFGVSFDSHGGEPTSAATSAGGSGPGARGPEGRPIR